MNQQIRIGSGNSYTDVGIQPPLRAEEVTELNRRYRSVAESNDPMAMFMTGHTVETRSVGDQDDTESEHTLLSFNTGDMCRANPEIYEKLAAGIAGVAVGFLIEIGDSVETHPRTIPVDGEHGLFGNHAQEIIDLRALKSMKTY